MNAAEKKYGKSFAGGENVVYLPLPNSLSCSKSDVHNSTAISGLPANDSARVDSDCLATIKGSPCILFVHTASFVFVKMPNSRKNLTAAGNNSTRSCTSAHDTRKSIYSKFLTEKDAKNRAYHFILSMGLLKAFTGYCRSVHTDDAHNAAVSILSTTIKSK